MPPQPLESVQSTTGANFVPNNEAPRSGTISLGMLIDFIIQRTYHDLTVLAELLPRKSDLDRKIEIYDFAARTRQLFIRLLALVKWANSASKVDKSSQIMSFLDKQSMLFVDTADTLARMARETLVHARLPNFHIPAAVEILTTGTYSRLPACIREKIVPPDPITAVEKRQTLSRLNQVIQHRLVTGHLLPQMRKFKIENGRVTFHVDHEFEVSLTLMGDAPDVPWRLLDIEILVEDKETGDGKKLVHPLQVNYIHSVVQSRLVDSQNSLAEVFHCLHYFCQSLQLEVLYTQTLRLMIDRLDDNIHVDQYVPGVKLTVSYWRELTSKDPRSELGYRFTVQTDPTDNARPLTVLHMPSISVKDSTEIANRSVRSDLLSIERLLVHIVYVRSVARLNDVKIEFQAFMRDVECHLQGTPAILTIPVLNPCLRAEQIHVTVDTHTGMLRCHVPKHLECPIISDLQNVLNSDMSKLQTLISELRFWITYRRCEKTLQHLPASTHEKLSLICPTDHPITKTGRHKIYVKLHRQPNVILMIEINEKADISCEMDYKFFLIHIKHKAIEEDAPVNAIGAGTKIEINAPKIFLHVESFIELDAFIVTHGPGTCVNDSCSAGKKRKFSGIDLSQPPTKMSKNNYPAYFIPELAHVVAMCDEKLPFVDLAKELTKRKITHTGLQTEANSTSLVLKLLTLPMPENKTPINEGSHRSKNIPVIDKTIWNALTKRLLSIALRTQYKSNNNNNFWMAELIFYETPLKSKHNREQSQRRPVYFQYELGIAESVDKTVDSLLEDWSRIVYLYCLVHDFAEQFKNELNLQNHISIKSYSYTNLLIGYGPNKEVTVNVFWCTKSKEFKLIFNGGNSAINAHSMMQEQLQSHLNRHHNLSQIVHLLHETYQPLSSIAKLQIIPQLGIKLQRPQIPVLSFCILPQSPNLLRLSYQTMYCLEIRLRGGGLVSIRDGAYSRFDRSNVIEEFTPTQGLKGFLSKYVDESAVIRRQSQSEDDNPPSPITMEDTHSGSPAFFSPRDAGLRFSQPITPPSCSNPHTPASPHPISQNQSHPNFSMTSPTGSHLPHPSPGNVVMPSSPLNPQPSPMAIANSPGPNLGYMHSDSSPFAAMSPAASNWPGSPMPRPSPRPGQSPEHKHQTQVNVPHLSRVLPARSWAGAVPTLLTNEALDTLCRPSPHPQKEINGPELSPLERFLGCVSMRRHLQRFIQSEDCITYIPSTEPGVVIFKTELVQCQVMLNPTNMQSLHIKITPLPISNVDVKPPVQWNPEELQTIEKFFELRVAAPPYRPNALCGFGRALNVPPQVMKDFVQLMQLDMLPEPLPGQKWAMQFIMRVPPPALVHIVSVGNPALYISNQKILFFIQLTRVPYLPGMDWKDSTTIVLPLVYVVNSNITQLVERREQVPSQIAMEANAQLRRFAEYPNPNGECSLFPAVRDLLMNLTMPNEAHSQQSTPQMPNQIAPSPVGPISASPNPMIHSPMQQINQGPHTPNSNNPDIGNQGPSGPNMPPQMYGMGGPNQN